MLSTPIATVGKLAVLVQALAEGRAATALVERAAAPRALEGWVARPRAVRPLSLIPGAQEYDTGFCS